MKRYFAGAAALLLLASASPAFAQDRDNGWNRDNGGYRDNHDYDRNRDRDDRDRDRDQRYSREYYRDRSGHEWHQGDTWRGHRLEYYNNRWGYWEPRNGSQFFVQFSL